MKLDNSRPDFKPYKLSIGQSRGWSEGERTDLCTVRTNVPNIHMALPCRISVFTDKGKTKIGLIKPVQMLSGLSQHAASIHIAKEVEEKTVQVVDEAK